ncbi:TPA: hypothetical protein JA971_12655 [Legionella pneumophila]|nr:hypothetical protein [Legionella pneumophila]
MAEEEFLSLDSPLILLGEPGAGKSEIVEHYYNSTTGSQLYSATVISALPTLTEINPLGKIIIDGVDEISAYKGGISIVEKILSKIPLLKKPNFILTCRAADWQENATAVIEEIYKVPPIIGYIVPFTEKDIIKFAKIYGENGEQFISEAHKHGIFDLIKNPNTLLLFIKGKINQSWPNNKSDLFKNACDNLLQEIRQPHRDHKRTIPVDDLFDAAGFICTQLLLADKEGVSIGESFTYAPHISEILNSEAYSKELINYALSTRIFRAKPDNVLVPCHRTVAEYLSAHWISKQLSKQLSFKRLQTILYSDNLTVPSAFRGLHAWLVTVNPTARRNCIKSDPYGLLKYGDCSTLSPNEKLALLEALKEMAITDPYFRGSDYYLVVGKELITSELIDEIVQILKTRETPFQLNDLLMDALEHTHNPELINASQTNLLSIVYNENLRNRRVALKLLLASQAELDWIELSTKLFDMKNIESKKLVLPIIECKPDLFSFDFISKIFISITDEANIGSGYKTLKQLSIAQIEACLKDFLTYLKINAEYNEKDNRPNKSYRRVQELIHDFLKEYFDRVRELILPRKIGHVAKRLF